MFTTPQTGDVITVTTRYKSISMYDDYVETTYKEITVTEPFSWLSKYEFCIPADGPETLSSEIDVQERIDGAPKFDQRAMRYESKYTSGNNGPKFDTRVLHMENVTAINGVDVSNEDYSVKEVKIPASKPGSTYTVQLEGGVGVSCECKGYQFRKTCRHLKEAEETV